MAQLQARQWAIAADVGRSYQAQQPQQCGSVDDFSDYIHDSQVDPRIHYLEMNQSCQAQYGTINALLLGP
jgi:hypothetical protein